MNRATGSMLAVALLAAVSTSTSNPALAWDKAKPGMTAKSLNVAANAAANARATATGRANATGGTSVANGGNAWGYAPPALALSSGGACTGVSTSASGGGALISLGFGRGEIDDDCTLRANIAVVGQFDPEAAREMIKDLTGYKAAAKRLGRQQ